MTTRPHASAAVRAALRDHEPTGEQWAAIAHPLEPVHLIAGAGSGKTAVMAARIVWAIEAKGFAPAQILGLTFTNKAAEELQERVRTALLVQGVHRPEDITVQTYNAFAAGVVREHGLLVGVEPEAGLLTEAQQWQLVLDCIDELPPFEAIELRSPGGIVRATLALAGSMSDHLVSPADVRAVDERTLSLQSATPDMRDTAAKRRELCGAVELYLRAKVGHGRIDFGDQVLKAVEVLEDFPQIQEQYAQRFPVVLLDEYQDTNVAQRRLIQALVRGGGAVTSVGDARQAIYAFRGATMYNLIGFPDHFPRSTHEPYAPISLSENFRSGARILGVANAVVSAIALERRPGSPLVAHESNGHGRVLLGLFGDERAEAAYVADEIERLHDERTAAGDPIRWRDMAILVRRKATMDPILEILEDRQIPVEVVGLGGLLKTPEVIEIVAWLRALDGRPAANRWLGRLLLGPRWRIHYRDLALCARWAAEQNRDLRLKLAGGDEARARDLEPGDVGFSLAEALHHLDEIDLPPEAARRLRAFSARLDHLRARMHAPLLELVQDVIREAGIADALESSASRTAPASRQNVANFLDHVAAFAPVEGEATLRSFLSYLDAADAAEETLESTQPAESDSVKLMTVHSAKGLEFECVFVPSVASSKNAKGEYVYSIFPDNRASNPLKSYRELPYEVREDASHLPSFTGKPRDFEAAVKERAMEDERRLFYVALTRAKQYLCVTAAHWYGRSDRPRGPSSFWDDLRALAESHGVEVVREDECPELNPVIDALQGKRAWPPEPRIGSEDGLFPEGWGKAADELVAGEAPPERWLSGLDGPGRERAAALLEEVERDLAILAAGERDDDAATPAMPDILWATSVVDLERGRKSVWDLMRPLPERPTGARALGVEIHRVIEERARGIAPFAEESELDEPSEGADRGAVDEMLARWRTLGYAERTPARLPSGEPMVEIPFALHKDGRIVRGRIDAVYECDDGAWEVVDVKTGERPGDAEDAGNDQLTLYAEALEANGLLPDGVELRLSYVYLDGGPPLTRTWARAGA
ncbi:MAG: ATP-dependent helicase [Actinomycetota bacterium]|nr:ATP-dependent helicase [Actinomycetota bacterium]